MARFGGFGWFAGFGVGASGTALVSTCEHLGGSLERVCRLRVEGL